MADPRMLKDALFLYKMSMSEMIIRTPQYIAFSSGHLSVILPEFLSAFVVNFINKL